MTEERAREDQAKEIYGLFLERASRDDEFNDWAGYREQLTDFIVRSIPAGGTLLILGAGKCNDLDLAKLAEHCGSITLSDYRLQTCAEGCARYGLTPSEHLNFLEADYVGIPDEAYIEYTDLLLGVMGKLAAGAEEACPAGAEEACPASLEEAAGPELDRLREGLERIYRSNAAWQIDLGTEVYDNVVVVGVHSQLNNSFRGLFQYALKDTEERCGRLPFAEELNRAVFEVTREHTEELVCRFNEAVFAAAGEGVIYGYERSMIYTPAGASGPVIGTVDGARQAGEAIEDLPAADQMSCLWPLSRRRKIKFEMTVCYLLTERGGKKA